MRMSYRAGLVVLCLILRPGAVSRAEPDAWGPFRFFIGSWEGDGTGQFGAAKVTREYAWILDGSFIEVRNRSIYPPQEKNPGEDHQDIGFISYDSIRAKHVLRQFHAEGFVNQYVHDSTSADGKTMTFTSESIENNRAGWRARETYEILGPDEFIERFELAEPGKEFELYVENRLRRKK